MSKKVKETSDRVWLAGLGALVIAEQEGNDLFQQLVKKGRETRGLFTLMQEKGSIKLTRPLSSSTISRKQYRDILVTFGIKDSPLHEFLPDAAEKASIEARQTRRLAAARRAFLKEFGGLDRSPMDWERLQRERKIFTVTYRGATYVPSFQFDEKGKPRRAVARVIQILGKDTSDWGLALWFTAASGSLDGKRPVDLLSSHPEEVVQAAEQEAAELVF